MTEFTLTKDSFQFLGAGGDAKGLFIETPDEESFIQIRDIILLMRSKIYKLDKIRELVDRLNTSHNPLRDDIRKTLEQK